MIVCTKSSNISISISIFFIFSNISVILCVNTKWLLCWQNEPDLVIRHVVEHLLDLCGVFHVGGDWVRGAEGVHFHGLETFPQEEVILSERKSV